MIWILIWIWVYVWKGTMNEREGKNDMFILENVHCNGREAVISSLLIGFYISFNLYDMRVVSRGWCNLNLPL